MLPKLGELPKEADWQGVDQEAEARVLKFPLELEHGQRGIRFHWEIVSPDEAVMYCVELAGSLGLQALAIADTLRRRYGLEALNLAIDWNFRESLGRPSR
ncbi:hypothetical protein [Pollutimonas harenae]|uniref:Uncharacterized protein n=1 Tax=Pollutimonas harenae TaxID=657015 RepID=A0A853H477_9BURK|nr:hypothetical protein [Pollutimonas harenae]NYT86830.1 hypothetical protein [Pollutimonas harenae]TEA71474.1 hypothetical protein ERD84_12730 [Pollutimonas harenae]